jgi:glucans biosynthesis protein C
MRYYYMDAMRGVLMILGIVLHASIIYASNVDWAVSDPVNNVYFYDIYAFIHVFRIPAFFIIAGFFSGMTISKYGIKNFLEKRTQRILVPLLSTAATINLLDSYLRYKIHTNGELGLRSFFYDYLPNTFVTGQWEHHLWFLLFLFFYFFIGIFFVKVLKGLSSSWKSKWQAVETNISINILILILPIFNIILLMLGNLFPDLFYKKIFGLFSLVSLGTYVPFYIVGLVFYYKPRLLKEFNSVKTTHFVFLIVSTIAYFYSQNIGNNVTAKIIQNYSYYDIAWILCAICFSVFYRFFNKDRKGFRYLSEASYSIYLFHQIIVIVFGYILIPFQISIYIKFLLVILLTTVTSLSMHHFFVLKLRLARLLFNGK